MKKNLFQFLVVLLVVFSCGEGGEAPDKPKVIKKEKISGFIQKGPFVSGTTVTMNELSAELVQTGKVFTSSIINDLGLFEVNNIELTSSFVEFTSNGFYFNEITGELSNSPITLTAISDIRDKNSINVNVLTHLDKKRVETLLKGGKSFAESKTQSRNELLSVFSLSLVNPAAFDQFDIVKNTEEGAVLLGLSVILQANRSVAQLTELLSRIQNDFSDNGKVDNESLLKSLRDSSIDLDFKKIRENTEKRFKELNINSPLPDFESQIKKFLNPVNLKITIEGEGSVDQKVVSSPGGREYPSNTVLELTPRPKEGWRFEGWSGDLSGSESPKTITMDKEKNVIVKFKRVDYELKVNIQGEGTVEEKIVTAPGGKTYPFQTVVELKAVPKEGWEFEKWTGDLTGVENPKNIAVDKAKTVTATFKKTIFKLINNGKTCACNEATPGQKGIVGGIEYEAVDNALLRTRVAQVADLSKLCTSLVTDMNSLFEDIPVGFSITTWDVSNVKDMKWMFMGATNFNQAIGHWNVSNVTNMMGMFVDSPFNQPIGDWNVGNVKDMSDMFYYSKFNQPIGNWNVSNVEKMSQMFGDNNQFNQPIGDWNVSNVIDMQGMFFFSSFNQPIGKWNVIKVSNMNGMFAASSFNQPIGDWKVINVVDMSSMFSGTPFNQPLENWAVSKVLKMDYMFQNSKFNQNISKWCVTNIKQAPVGFSLNAPLTSANRPIWGSCPD
jgi:uncharacterized repeat protein (TIGR02543 family)